MSGIPALLGAQTTAPAVHDAGRQTAAASGDAVFQLPSQSGDGSDRSGTPGAEAAVAERDPAETPGSAPEEVSEAEDSSWPALADLLARCGVAPPPSTPHTPPHAASGHAAAPMQVPDPAGAADSIEGATPDAMANAMFAAQSSSAELERATREVPALPTPTVAAPLAATPLLTPPAAVTPLSSPAPASAANPLTTPIPLDQPHWAETFCERLQWSAEHGVSEATLELHPAELGPIRVRIETLGDQTSVLIQATHAATRELLGVAMPQLRDLLQGQGLRLGRSQVSDWRGRADTAQADETPINAPASRRRWRLGLVDAYA